MTVFETLMAELAEVRPVRHFGQVTTLHAATLMTQGLSKRARLGDRVMIADPHGRAIGGEILALNRDGAEVLPESPVEGLAIGDRVEHLGRNTIAPDISWIGRVIDPYGTPLDGRPLAQGARPRALRMPPPSPTRRKRLGGRLSTGLDAFNTVLPIVRGQRIGLFAGSGVGKTMLLGQLARGIEADVVVLALVGERGRELRDFTESVLGPEGLARSVVVSATSDESPLARRRAAYSAMAVAEHFRDLGQHVLLLCDSVTRFAEAHREIALAAGEAPSLRGFPPSTAHQIMALAERAGPGEADQGDITAVFTVLVAGSDMDEPVADILRGVLDGHVVLDRTIAERGRFPAIDLMRSVSRSLPGAATPTENAQIAEVRRLVGAWERAEMMVQAGLYAQGSDPLTDRAIKLWPRLDAYLGGQGAASPGDSFARLRKVLDG
ncbi:MAG: FliI/YscN family ATPase [Rhodobacter sp.]|uniref:FliI/YscN family ATPase n=1 Tax=Pararhodobacter sp. TaxID=2127056 RepID=UPI001DFE710C|nr:FliI/YscN family ATPase [Pararhodobacter sp.]MCB1346603.1 FliI/YscN family ATPase [Paracoccaceae bacterium]MCC0072832.1 FliI/YscN family ATPase [Rhodobacter sp.]HPD90940.1 FliI/YscN family ATPase [Pararhodobacter sp.]